MELAPKTWKVEFGAKWNGLIGESTAYPEATHESSRSLWHKMRIHLPITPNEKTKPSYVRGLMLRFAMLALVAVKGDTPISKKN